MTLPAFSHPSIAVFWSIWLFAIVYALARGGRPEKYAALIQLCASGIQMILYQFTHVAVATVDAVGVLADTVLVVGYVTIALNARRHWPMWAASLCLLSLTSHFSRFANSELVERGYSILSASPTAAVLLLLIIGTIGHQRRLKTNGTDPDWVDWKLASDLRSQRAI